MKLKLIRAHQYADVGRRVAEELRVSGAAAVRAEESSETKPPFLDLEELVLRGEVVPLVAQPFWAEGVRDVFSVISGARQAGRRDAFGRLHELLEELLDGAAPADRKLVRWAVDWLRENLKREAG